MNAYGTKVSKSRLGSPRFAGNDGPANGPVISYTLSPEELAKIRGGKVMDLNDELKKLEVELESAAHENINLQNLLDDLQTKYNELSLDYETAEQLRYDLTRSEGQGRQLRASLKETEEVLEGEVNKREILEQALRLYL